MTFKTFIIISTTWLILIAGTSTLAKEENQTKPQILKHLESQPFDSQAWANLALIQLQNQQAGKAQISAERALYLNPLSTRNWQIKSQVSDALYEQSQGLSAEDSVPRLLHMMDLIPDLWALILALAFFAFFIWIWTRTRLQEKTSFRPSMEGRLKSSLVLGLFAAFLALHLIKTFHNQTTWACLHSEAALYSGPGENFNQIHSLPLGSCFKIIQQRPAWISVSPRHKPQGWVSLKHAKTVRGKGFDPIQDTD